MLNGLRMMMSRMVLMATSMIAMICKETMTTKMVTWYENEGDDDRLSWNNGNKSQDCDSYLIFECRQCT